MYQWSQNQMPEMPKVPFTNAWFRRLFPQDWKLICEPVARQFWHLVLNSLDLMLYEHAEMFYAKQKQIVLSFNQPQVHFWPSSCCLVLFTCTGHIVIYLQMRLAWRSGWDGDIWVPKFSSFGHYVFLSNIPKLESPLTFWTSLHSQNMQVLT